MHVVETVSFNTTDRARLCGHSGRERLSLAAAKRGTESEDVSGLGVQAKRPTTKLRDYIGLGIRNKASALCRGFIGNRAKPYADTTRTAYQDCSDGDSGETRSRLVNRRAFLRLPTPAVALLAFTAFTAFAPIAHAAIAVTDTQQPVRCAIYAVDKNGGAARTDFALSDADAWSLAEVIQQQLGLSSGLHVTSVCEPLTVPPPPAKK